MSCAAFAQSEEERLHISRIEFQQHVAELDLAVAQREAAETMFAEYTREFDDALQMYNKLLTWLWSTHDSFDGGNMTDADFNSIVSMEQRSMQVAWARGWLSLENRYFDGLQRIAAGLEEKVASFRRAHVRGRMIPRYVSVDLIALTAKQPLSIAFNESLRPILNEYELTLDGMLRRLDEHQVTFRQRLDRLGDARRAAEKAGRDALPEQTALANAYFETAQFMNEIQALLEATVDRMLEALPLPERAAFEDSIYIEVHPYLKPEKNPTVEQAFQTALARTDLTADQLSNLDGLRDEYRKTRNIELTKAIRAYRIYSDPAASRAIFLARRTDGEQQAYELARSSEQAWNEALRAWRSMCDAFLEKIKSAVRETGDVK